ncbi:MAG: efflux RND transporter permease subunit [Candidatus Aminicenantes bacterium]|nr:efflux RND transporter permease subunit [Candidatus Aminicenantes bacterium]
MFLSTISIKRPILITMVLLVFLIFGVLSYFTLNLNLMPDIEFGFVTVQTIYPGAGPREIETQITKKIEDAISTISGIDYMNSYSMESASILVIRFKLGKDPDIANQEVKDKVNAMLNELPRDTELPVIQKFDVTAMPIMDLILSGPQKMTELYDLVDKRLKDRISQVEDVARVDVIGGGEREIRVELDNRIVFQNGLSLPQISSILAAYNMDLPGGTFQQRTQEYSVRMRGEFEDLKSIQEVEVPTAYGVKKLGQIAEVKDASEDIRERTIYFNNLEKVRDENVILLSIVKTADGNTVNLAQGIRRELPSIAQDLPPGANLSIISDDSLFIESSVQDTLGNILLGILFTGVVLLFFLHDIRSTIIVALAMPYSILSTFLLMQISGFTLNIMTLMGLSTAVGILVTNSVVVLENIFRFKQMGQNRRDASDRGTSEIAVAVIASTLTNIVVFLPIASMTSLAGQFFREFALTVTFATIFSLLVSFTLTPMLASLILPENQKEKRIISRKLDGMFKAWERGYAKVLEVLLRRKWRSALVVFLAIVMFIASFPIAGRVGFEFLPTLDEGNISIEVELPEGYRLEETSELIYTIEERIKTHSEVKHMVSTLGKLSDVNTGTNTAMIRIKLVDAAERELSSNDMANLFIQEVSDIPNAKIRITALSSAGGGGAAVDFFLLGQDVDVLERYKDEIIARIRDVEGLINLNTSSRAGKPEITLVPDRKKVSDAGLTVSDLAFALRSAIEGVIATQYREGGEEYDIRVVLTDESVDTPEEVGNIVVAARSGTYRLSQFADIRFTEGYSSIQHKDKYKTIEITGGAAVGYPVGNVIAGIGQRLRDLDLPAGYKIAWGGSAKMIQETSVDMLRTFLIAFVLVYMLLAAILESLTQPLVILGTVPMALIGVFLALFLTGKTLNTISMMAIIMLLGIVVNNAILMLDYANLLRRQGKDMRTALVEACPTKFKPIVMATVAIILGMLPLALGIGASGVEIRQPMGIVAIGGLIVSSVLTLIVIPSILNLATRSKRST